MYPVDPTSEKPMIYNNGNHPLNNPGKKADAGKPHAGRVITNFSRTLSRVAELDTLGAQKYDPENWLKVPDGYNRYRDAFGRHLLKMETEGVDPETGHSHLIHAIWNLLVMSEYVERGIK